VANFLIHLKRTQPMLDGAAQQAITTKVLRKFTAAVQLSAPMRAKAGILQGIGAISTPIN
jgi:hypothetical protein